MKLRYIGTNEAGITQDKAYHVIEFLVNGALSALILDDTGLLKITGEVRNTSEWVVVSDSD